MVARKAHIGDVQSDYITGDTGWEAKSYTLTRSGTHTLRWRCIKNSSGTSGSDCGWVDYVQTPVPADWQTITYTYDPSGRRIAKSYDGQTVAKYLYDGPSLIAEYDGFDNLLRKYIYGPGIDQPICMIDVADANETYYYHFDGLGSVVALTDDAGDTVEVYEYSIFGEVSASDPNHPNPFMFTGREFDKETGLYYYRARYYNPYIGRFLQTDPAGSGYGYCGNDPVGSIDPSGATSYELRRWKNPLCTYYTASDDLRLYRIDASGQTYLGDWGSLSTICDDLMRNPPWPDGTEGDFTDAWMASQVGWKLSQGNEWWFWRIKVLMWLDPDIFGRIVTELEGSGKGVDFETWSVPYGQFFPPGSRRANEGINVEWKYKEPDALVVWNPNEYVCAYDPSGNEQWWYTADPLASLAHEIAHAWHWAVHPTDYELGGGDLGPDVWRDIVAVTVENSVRYQIYYKVPAGYWTSWPRPGYGWWWNDLGQNPDEAWANYHGVLGY
jgi:RHS repeat-associated protein